MKITHQTFTSHPIIKRQATTPHKQFSQIVSNHKKHAPSLLLSSADVPTFNSVDQHLEQLNKVIVPEGYQVSLSETGHVLLIASAQEGERIYTSSNYTLIDGTTVFTHGGYFFKFSEGRPDKLDHIAFHHKTNTIMGEVSITEEFRIPIDGLEKLRTDFDQFYSQAQVAKQEIDTIADMLMQQVTGKVLKIQLKPKEEALRQAVLDHKGDFRQLKNFPNNNIIVKSEDDLEKASQLLKKQGFQIYTIIHPLGYRYIDARKKGTPGMSANIQMMTPDVVFASENKQNAILMMGEDLYKTMEEGIHIETTKGGEGYKNYKEWVKLNPRSPEAITLARSSYNYYERIRTAYKKLTQSHVPEATNNHRIIKKSTTTLKTEFDNFYSQAQFTKKQIDSIADQLTLYVDGQVIKVLLKPKPKTLIANHHESNPNLLNDFVKNKVLVKSEDEMKKAAQRLRHQGFKIATHTDALGYRCVYASTTNSPVIGRIEISTLDTVYATRDKKAAINILGEELYYQIQRELNNKLYSKREKGREITEVEIKSAYGNYAEQYHRAWKKLDPQSKEAIAIAKESNEYYELIRNAYEILLHR